MLDWRDRLRTIVTTAAVTSLGWVVVGAVWWVGYTAPPRSAEAVAFHATESPTPGRLLIPVQGIRASQLTDTFTQAREGGARVHDAIDIMAPLGTPVLAAASGTVEKLFTSNAGGLTIYLRSPDRRTIHYYAHLASYAPGLSEGQNVRAGQTIGAVGFTGNANAEGPHLHFAVMQTSPAAPWYRQATAINPYPLLVQR